MYHAILVAYLQWARMLGFRHVHIWVEPPKMGDEYIFFARSDQQRKPMKREKLREWYKRMLDKAKDKGGKVVEDAEDKCDELMTTFNQHLRNKYDRYYYCFVCCEALNLFIVFCQLVLTNNFLGRFSPP